MIKSKMVPASAFAPGVSRFAQILCSLVADVPALPKLFTQGVLIPCINAGVVQLKQMKWQGPPEDPDDDFIEVEGHYIVMAHVITSDLCKGSKADKMKWFSTNVPTMTEKTYVDAVLEVNYLIE